MAQINGKNLCLFCFQPIAEGAGECEHCKNKQTEIIPSMFLPVGSVLEERYQVGRVLSHNEFIVTYHGYDLKEDRSVVVKEFFPKSLSERTAGEKEVRLKGEEFTEKFKEGSEALYNEARTIALFSENPNIIDIYEMFYDNNTSYYVTEFSAGKTVEKYVKEKGGKITIQDCFETLEPLFGTLAVMHDQNLCHRNIAPDNIMLTDDGNIKLLGFGIARETLAKSLGDWTIGLLDGFAAPEQYQRKGKIGPWTDIYSMVATCYYCVTGVPPTPAPARIKGEEIKDTSVYGVVLKASFKEMLNEGMRLYESDRCDYAPDVKNMLRKCSEDGMKDLTKKDKEQKGEKDKKSSRSKRSKTDKEPKEENNSGEDKNVEYSTPVATTPTPLSAPTPIQKQVLKEEPKEEPKELPKEETKHAGDANISSESTTTYGSSSPAAKVQQILELLKGKYKELIGEDKKKKMIFFGGIALILIIILFLIFSGGKDENTAPAQQETKQEEVKDQDKKKDDKKKQDKDQKDEKGKNQDNPVKWKDTKVAKVIAANLKLRPTKITSKDLAKVKELTLSKLTLSSYEDLYQLTNLQKLTISGCKLKSLKGLEKLSKLTELKLENCGIKDVSALSSLKSVKGLKVLSLADNEISEVKPLAKLTGLKSLDLSKNKITKFDALNSLKKTKINKKDQKVKPEKTPAPVVQKSTPQPVVQQTPQPQPVATPAPAAKKTPVVDNSEKAQW